MPMPTYEQCMLPFLKLCESNDVVTIREAVRHCASVFDLSEEERNELLPSGKVKTIRNRTSWAGSYLVKAGLLTRPRRGEYQITPRGTDFLSANQGSIKKKDLMQFDEFQSFVESPSSNVQDTQSQEEATPQESLESAFQTIRDELSNELLDTIKSCSPGFFEQLVIDLLIAMGYGGSRKEAGTALRTTRDEGIDGIINEDRLGLDVIYVQAKRWQGTVGRPQIQGFAGSLDGKRAKKGIFITTSSFTKDASEFVELIEKKIVLIDGESLAKYKIDFGIGVAEEATYAIHRIDTDYFEAGIE